MHLTKQELSTPTPKLNLLVAYPYMTKLKIDLINQNLGNIRFVLDSGAFTAQTLGKKFPSMNIASSSSLCRSSRGNISRLMSSVIPKKR